MASGGQPGGNTATLNLILGVFLKLLGFFVVLYGFNEIDPVKAHQAEASIKDRFNISVSLTPIVSGLTKTADAPVQTKGRAYSEIEEELKTQVDLLSSRYEADSDTLVLRLPASVVLSFEGKPATSPDFASTLAATLEIQRGKDSKFNLEIIADGNDDEALIASVSLFVQKMLGTGYPRDLLTIGYQDGQSDPMVEFRVKQVRA